MNPLFLALKVQLDDYDHLQADFSGIIKGRWIPSEDIHITVSYFGRKYDIDELLERLPQFIVPIESFKLSGLGYFASNRILYAKGESLELGNIFSSINDAFSLGETKPFIPHATLMRVKAVEDTTVFKKILSDYQNREIGTVEATFELIQSIRHPRGVRYERIKKFYM